MRIDVGHFWLTFEIFIGFVLAFFRFFDVLGGDDVILGIFVRLHNDSEHEWLVEG